LVSWNADAEKFPAEASIAAELNTEHLRRLPAQTKGSLLALAGAEADPHIVADILLDVLVQRSTLGGVIVAVTDVHVVEVQEKAEAIFAFFYRNDDAALTEALRYWNARNRNSAVGLPIQWGEAAHRASTPVAALAVVAMMYLSW